VFYVKPKSTLNFYVYAAAMPLGDRSEYAARASARFSLSSISKNTSLNVNFVYMSHNTTSSEKTNHRQNILSSGASMQYNFLTGRVTPYVEGGIGLAYQTDNDPLFDAAQKFGISLVIAAGMEGYVTKNLVIKADWRYELFTHYPVIGVAWFFK
jgi:opacity protein-like surface antigen